jgi:hypothetical protein
MYQISCWFEPGAVGWVPSSVYGLLVNWGGATLFDSTNFLDTWTNIQLQASATSTSTELEFGYWVDEVTSLDNIDVFPISAALGIARQGTSVVISWPEAYSGYTLQSATNLSSSWVPVSGVASNQVAVTPSLTQQFYRLAPP